jgi:hypothetical protein
MLSAFSYGAGHWFEDPLVSWAIANHVTLATSRTPHG